MRTAILLTTLVASALASPKPAIEVVEIREISDAKVREIARRQASSFDLGTLIPTACLPPTTLPAAPTYPADLESAIVAWSDPCHEPSFTGKLSSELSSYKSAASVWAKSVEPAMLSWESAYKTACPYATSIPLTVLPSTYSFAASCGASATKGGAAATASGAGAASGGGSTGAAPQQTAFAAAGMLAGVAGVLAAL